MFAWLARECPLRFSNGGMLIITSSLVAGLVDSIMELVS